MASPKLPTTPIPPQFKVVGGLIGIAVVVFIVIWLANLLKGVAGGLIDALNRDPQKLVDSTTTQDGTSTEDIEDSFKGTAKGIADAQYTNLSVGFWTNTNEQALFNPLGDLNGAQLQMVYVEFGIRDGKDLFAWYAGELSTNLWTGLVWTDDRIEGCTSYVDNCTESDMMRAVWVKSGLPLSF